MSTPTQMRAARFHGPGPNGSIKIEEVPVPTPSNSQLLVKIESAGLCLTDFELFNGHTRRKIRSDKWSVTPGHEACGRVAKLGANISKFREGDAIGFLPYLNACGRCGACSVSAVACRKTTVQGFNADGFVAEYALVEESQAIRLPDGMEPKTSAPLFCAGLTAFHSIDKAGLGPGDYVCIVGIGGLGQLAVQYAIAMGYKVIAIDIGEAQLRRAKELGASEVFNATTPGLTFKVQELTLGGVGAVVVLSGSVKAYETGLGVLRIGGTLVVVGVTDPESLPLPAIMVSCGLVQVKGASSGRMDEMEKAVSFSHKHQIQSNVLECGLDEYPAMVEKMRAGEITTSRVIVNRFH